MRSDIGNKQLYYICPSCGRPSLIEEHACKCGYRLSDMLPVYRLCPDCKRFVPQSQARCDCGHSFPMEEQLLHVCPACGSVLPLDQLVCDCGYQFYPKAAPAPAQPIPDGDTASSNPPATDQVHEAAHTENPKHTLVKAVIWLLSIVVYGFIVVFFPSTEITKLSMRNGLLLYILEMALLVATCFVSFKLCRLVDMNTANISPSADSSKESQKSHRRIIKVPHIVLFILSVISVLVLGPRGTLSSTATVIIQPLQSVEYIGQAIDRIGHSDSGDLSTWRPYDPNAMGLTIYVNTVRDTLRENILFTISGLTSDQHSDYPFCSLKGSKIVHHQTCQILSSEDYADRERVYYRTLLDAIDHGCKYCEKCISIEDRLDALKEATQQAGQ